MGLDPNTRLRRAPELRLELDSSNFARILHDGSVIDVGAYGLTVLDVFSRPTSMREALALLKPRIRGAQDWIDVTSTIVQLHGIGVLQDEAQAQPTLRSGEMGFDAAHIHVLMLNDATRVERYVEAIRTVVRPGDVVLDVGTGTGILAMAAVRAGARHVYAVEASGIGRVAQAMFEANGLAERITLVPGWSTQVDLPERADVMVSEIIGNEALGEHVLEVVLDAKKRLLKPGSRLIPSGLRVRGLAVTIPPDEVEKRTFTAEAARAWTERYGLDFGPLARVPPAADRAFFPWPRRARDWPVLSEPAALVDIVFADALAPAVGGGTTVRATAAGRMNGLLVYFDLEIAPGVELTTHPHLAEDRCSWRNGVWILPEAFEARLGDAFAVSYAHAGIRGQVRIEVRRA
jgi:2-polyprenyl-3-methyl-5-hydroxy-6-metoxy-1,4-benzoquinol methylase